MYEYRRDPSHRPILVVDIENSSGRPEYVRARLQRDTHDVIARVLAEAGVAPGEFTLDERGDGALVTLPSDASKSRLTEVCLHSLPVRLRRLAAQHSEFGRLRLRVALNAGDISRTEQGSWLGSAVDTAFRLVDAGDTKAALAESGEAVMVLIVSDSWFEDVVRPGLGAVSEGEFRKLTITSHQRDFPAWLALPGVALETAAASAPAAAPVTAPAPAHVNESAAEPSSRAENGSTAASDHGHTGSRDTYYISGDQIGRDKNVHNYYREGTGPE